MVQQIEAQPTTKKVNFTQSEELGNALNRFLTKEKNPTNDPLMPSLKTSVQRLIWTSKDGKVSPGVLLDDKKALADRLVNDWREYKDPQYRVNTLKTTLARDFLQVKQDPITGKAMIKIPYDPYTGRFEKDGPLDNPYYIDMGDTRGRNSGIQRDASLVIRPDENTTFTDLTLELAPEDPIKAELLNIHGEPTGKEITAKPILQATLKKEVDDKGTEETKLYRTLKGLVVVCSDGTAKCYPYRLSDKAHITS